MRLVDEINQRIAPSQLMPGPFQDTVSWPVMRGGSYTHMRKAYLQIKVPPTARYRDGQKRELPPWYVVIIGPIGGWCAENVGEVARRLRAIQQRVSERLASGSLCVDDLLDEEPVRVKELT